ncbi:hypothetical protein C8R45DRAFT_1186320 [Mycena sanguinolenta]|nr:hypothetical protein C8R45DRAFT_1186320 [Mycena sanguinolenta]
METEESGIAARKVGEKRKSATNHLIGVMCDGAIRCHLPTGLISERSLEDFHNKLWSDSEHGGERWWSLLQGVLIRRETCQQHLRRTKHSRERTKTIAERGDELAIFSGSTKERRMALRDRVRVEVQREESDVAQTNLKSHRVTSKTSAAEFSRKKKKSGGDTQRWMTGTDKGVSPELRFELRIKFRSGAPGLSSRILTKEEKCLAKEEHIRRRHAAATGTSGRGNKEEETTDRHRRKIDPNAKGTKMAGFDLENAPCVMRQAARRTALSEDGGVRGSFFTIQSKRRNRASVAMALLRNGGVFLLGELQHRIGIGIARSGGREGRTKLQQHTGIRITHGEIEAKVESIVE